MSGLTEFLLARIAEDATMARATYPFGPIWEDSEDHDGMAQNEARWRLQVHTSECGYRMLEFGEPCACGYPARVLAECEAKRAIVEMCANRALDEHPFANGRHHPGLHPWSRILRLLALPYADHADYREEWRP